MSTKIIKLSEDQANRLGSKIKELGFSKNKAAAMANISAGYLSDILNLKKVPLQRTFSDICRALSISERFVLTGIDQPDPTPTVRDPSADYYSPITRKIADMVEAMDEETRKDICLSVEKEKLLRELLRQKDSNEKAS